MEQKHHCKCGGCQQKKNQKPPKIPDLSLEEKQIIGRLQQYHYLPICQFIMAKQNEGDVRFIALAPVYLENGQEDMATVKTLGAALKTLEEKKIITLDYDMPLKGFDYGLYGTSRVYKELKQAVKEGSQRPGFLCDTTEMEQGSIALTPYGEELLDYITVAE